MDVTEHEICQRIVRSPGKQLLKQIPGLIGAPNFLERRGGRHPCGRLVIRARNGCLIEEQSEFDERLVEPALLEERVPKGVAYLGVIGNSCAKVLDRLTASPNLPEERGEI